jgi:hypothetical protein
VQALGLIVLGILAIYAYEQRQIRVLEQSARETANQLETRRAQLVAFSKQFSDQGTTRALTAELQAGEARLHERRALLNDVRTGVGGDVLGYSRYLVALARAATAGVWLTGLEIGGKSGDMVIKARAVESALVPAYIRALTKESAFGGRAVGALQITSHGAAKPPVPPAGAPAEPTQYVEFSLRIPAKGGS